MEIEKSVVEFINFQIGSLEVPTESRHNNSFRAPYTVSTLISCIQRGSVHFLLKQGLQGTSAVITRIVLFPFQP